MLHRRLGARTCTRASRGESSSARRWRASIAYTPVAERIAQIARQLRRRIRIELVTEQRCRRHPIARSKPPARAQTSVPRDERCTLVTSAAPADREQPREVRPAAAIDRDERRAARIVVEPAAAADISSVLPCAPRSALAPPVSGATAIRPTSSSMTWRGFGDRARMRRPVTPDLRRQLVRLDAPCPSRGPSVECGPGSVTGDATSSLPERRDRDLRTAHAPGRRGRAPSCAREPIPYTPSRSVIRDRSACPSRCASSTSSSG